MSESGPRLVLVRNGAYDPSKVSFGELAQMRQLVSDIVMMEDDYAVVSGIIFVMDFSQVGASHLFQVSPSVMRKVSQYSEQALPLRVKASHFIDTPPGFEPVFNLIKPILPEKIQNRVSFPKDLKNKLFLNISSPPPPRSYLSTAANVKSCSKSYPKNSYPRTMEVRVKVCKN